MLQSCQMSEHPMSPNSSRNLSQHKLRMQTPIDFENCSLARGEMGIDMGNFVSGTRSIVIEEIDSS